MSKLKIKQNIPDGWKEKSILGCLDLPSKLAGIKLSEYEKEGDFPVFDQGQDYISGYSSKKDLVIDNVPAILFGDHTRVVKYIKSPFVAGADGTKIFWAKDDIDINFLYYSVLNQKIPNTGYNRHFKFFKDVNISLPKSKKEQQKIAEILGVVDEDISKTQEVIGVTEKLKKGLMQQLFTRGINHTKFKKTKLGKIPEDWGVGVLGDYLIKKPEYGLNASAASFDENLPTYIRITDISESGEFIHEGKKSVDHSAVNNYFLAGGDLLFARTGASVGKTYLYKKDDGQLVFAGFLIRIRSDINKLLPEYLAFLVQTSTYWNWIRVMSARSGQPGINGNEYASMPVIIPHISEQQKIAEILSAVDEKISVNKKLKVKLTQLKKGLMQDLLSGNVRVKI